MTRGMACGPGRQQGGYCIFSPLDSTDRRRDVTMRCLLLQGKYMIFCTAIREGYIPSTFELDEYCRLARHKMCPLYCKAETNGKFDFGVDAKK
jgi:hypothetical protein